MFAIAVLLFLISYIFAVMFTQLFKNLYETGVTGDIDYFGRIDKTFFTLFQIMTLDAWSDIAREVMQVYAWAWLPFIVFVILTGFVVVNLIIAVICDAISALHDDEKAKLHGNYEESLELGPAHPAELMDVKEQLDTLEMHVNELSNMQEQTLRTVAALAQQLASSNQQLRATCTRAASGEQHHQPLSPSPSS
jgi:methyl-accepting chemotaxis protein